jgi:hypothetical protein
MKRVVLIACVETKAGHRTEARHMYISPLFKFMLRYAETLRPDAIFVLSAKHRLLGLDKKIAPYEATLNKMPVAQVREWAEKVLGQLGQEADLKNDQFIILASKKYRKYLVPHMRRVKVPLEGLDFGKQLRQLKKWVEQ